MSSSLSAARRFLLLQGQDGGCRLRYGQQCGEKEGLEGTRRQGLASLLGSRSLDASDPEE